MNSPLATPDHFQSESTRTLAVPRPRTHTHSRAVCAPRASTPVLSGVRRGGPATPARSRPARTVPRAPATRHRWSGPGARGGRTGRGGSSRPWSPARRTRAETAGSEAAAPRTGRASPGATGKHRGDPEARPPSASKKYRERPRSSGACLLALGVPFGQAEACPSGGHSPKRPGGGGGGEGHWGWRLVCHERNYRSFSFCSGTSDSQG